MTAQPDISRRAMEAQASMRKSVHDMLVRKAKLGEYVIIADKDGNPIRVKAEDALKLAEEDAPYNANGHADSPQANE